MTAKPQNKPQPATDRRETADVVELKIDGRVVRALKGQNLLEAMQEAGEEVSSFCYHPGLSVVAKCRQCLVGVGDAHKLLPACQLTVQPEMSIRSKTEQVLEARQAMLEMTLLNHPVDCVICDKAGECALQRHYMDWDGRPAAINHTKVYKPKKVELGPEIVLDAERCILCDRCVRFCTEIAGQPQLVFSQRGDHTILTTAPGEQLDNPYALNTVDICPVGALTDRDFRFKSRVWDLWATESTCNGCAAGCAIEVHHKDNTIYRVVPRKRWDTNLNWLCDYGRRTYKPVAEGRVTRARLGGEEAELDAAVKETATQLRALAEQRADAIAVVIGADASNEDAFAATQFAREVLSGRIYFADRPDDGNGDTILRQSDPNPNRTGTRAIVAEATPTVAGPETLAEHLAAVQIEALDLVGGALPTNETLLGQLGSLELLIVQATHDSPLTQQAHIVLPAATWAEVDGTITSGDGTIKRMRAAVEPPGYARPHWALVDSVAVQMGRSRYFTGAKDVFETMREQVAFFRRAGWGEELPTTQLRWACRRG